MISKSTDRQNLKINKDNREAKLGNHYKILFASQLGHGGFGRIYLGYDWTNGSPLAIKVESITTHSSKLKNEAKILQLVQGGTGIPRYIAFIEEKSFDFFLMQLLGKHLGLLFKICNKAFSLHTILSLAYQMLCRVEYIHSKYIIHRDIKPENFWIGADESSRNIIYLIDYGWSKKYMDSKTKEHLPYKNGKTHLIGTERYCSIYTHMGMEQSRRDDLESLVYVILYFYLGKLPWQGWKRKSKKEKYQWIMEKKLDLNYNLINKNGKNELSEIWELLNYIKSIEFDEEPDYKMCKKFIWNALECNGLVIDGEFDWKGVDLDKEEERVIKEEQSKNMKRESKFK